MRWSPGRKYRELRMRLDAVESLAAVKDVFSYDELSPLLGLPASVLSRYYQGSMVPNVDTARSMLDVFLSKEFARNFIYKAIHERYGGSLCKLLSNSKVVKFIGLYMYKRILNHLAGSKIAGVIAPTGHALAIASNIAQRFGISLIPIPNQYLSRCYLDTKGTVIPQGSPVVAVYTSFGRDELPCLKEFLSRHKLSLKLIETIVLTDIIPQCHLPDSVEIDYILP